MTERVFTDVQLKKLRTYIVNPTMYYAEYGSPIIENYSDAILSLMDRLECAEAVTDLLVSGYGCKHEKVFKAIEYWRKSAGRE